jgi:RNA polymerase sigma-70 factor (sigma-E family)
VASRSRDGDEPVSFAVFVGTRQHALLRSAYLMTGDHHLAEDLLQGALAKLAMRWERIRDGEPEAYVRRILYRDGISFWRKHRRETVQVLTDDPGTPDETRGVDDRLALLAALQTLTPKQRAVVVLRYYEDLTEQQAAHVLGVSVGTVKSQTHVALQRLRGEFERLRETETEAT